MKKIFLLISLMFLVSCVKPLPYANYLPDKNFYKVLPKNKVLIGTVKVGKVTLDEDIHSFLDASGFKDALTSALLEANFNEYGLKPASYVLDAQVKDIILPFIGLNFNVTSKIHYRLRELSTGKILLSEVITIKHGVGFFEELNGQKRAIKAFSGSIKNNIAHLIKILSIKTKF